MIESRPIKILMIEDDDGDVMLTREALTEARSVHTLHVAHDGEEGLRFLRQSEGFQDAPRPDLILLDLNLPRVDGREVLAEIKMDPDLKNIPVVVLTTSDDERDVRRSYELHANSYVTKPVDFERFQTVVQAIDEFWRDIARLPDAQHRSG